MSTSAQRGSGFFSPPPQLTPSQLSDLKAHVVNLNQGFFSSGGRFQTTLQDVKAIFGKHIPEWIEATGKDEANVVFYSHGGLTNEAWGLAAAHKQAEWWLSNDIYPIFFVWETGMFETLWQIFRGGESRVPQTGSRSIGDWFSREWFDELEDRAWEELVRTFGGGKVWGGMKASAKRAFEDADGVQGDGLSVLDCASDFYAESDAEIRFHAVGHSAGSIFVSRMIHAMHALYEGFPLVETVHFLAPAITSDLFRSTLKPLLGTNQDTDQAKHLALFTMNDALERDDIVGPYDKSLLYLIHHALEPQKETHILGLEHSLRSEADMAELFRLNGGNSRTTDIVFSLTKDHADKQSRSRATKHGDFDDDPATMNSVCRRILGIDDDEPIKSFPARRGPDPTQLPRTVGTWTQTATQKIDPGSVPSVSPKKRPKSQSFPSVDGDKKSLCIGINDYPGNGALFACEADATSWHQFFESNGFTSTLLLSQQATRDAIYTHIEDLISSSRAGDVIAIQYAGHGTTVPDENGDEAIGDTPGHDEALVPVDFMTDGLLLDDDLGELCRNIPAGVNVTFFFDCCHSGTMTRMFMSTAPSQSHGKQRFLTPTHAIIDANRAARARRGSSRSFHANSYKGRHEILFAACKSGEVAWESNGSGDFTRRTLKILGQTGLDITTLELIELIKDEFGTAARQTPGLWCDPELECSRLLGGRNA